MLQLWLSGVVAVVATHVHHTLKLNAKLDTCSCINVHKFVAYKHKEHELASQVSVHGQYKTANNNVNTAVNQCFMLLSLINLAQADQWISMLIKACCSLYTDNPDLLFYSECWPILDTLSDTTGTISCGCYVYMSMHWWYSFQALLGGVVLMNEMEDDIDGSEYLSCLHVSMDKYWYGMYKYL